MHKIEWKKPGYMMIKEFKDRVVDLKTILGTEKI